MKEIKKLLSWIIALPLLAVLTRCAVIDDIPFPIIEAQITAFEVEGQCDASGRAVGNAEIDAERRTIEVYVNDSVDISNLRVTRLEVSNGAQLSISKDYCLFPEVFPKDGFSSASPSSYTRIDCTRPVELTLHTYQDYIWKIKVHQVISREVKVKNQIGEAVIDDVSEKVVIYVSKTQNLKTVSVEKFSLGGDRGKVSPDPTKMESYDFSRERTFDVTYGWSNQKHQWRVFVYQTDEQVKTEASVFAHSVTAYVNGTKPNDVIPVVEYRSVKQEEWTKVTANMNLSSTMFNVTIDGLTPGSDYECRVTAGSETTSVIPFHTAPAQQLENASFDEWSSERVTKFDLWRPWAEGSTGYWDTGNRGATTVGASNSTGVTEGGRTFANLQSKYIVIKFAAGNIFTGTYVATDGTNGILGFGRPFTSFPTKLRFDYKYKTSAVNRGGGKWDSRYGKYISQKVYDEMKGQPDSCQIYVALIGDKDEETYEGVTYPYLIRTRPSDLKLFNPRSENVIAYAQLTQGNNVSAWTTETLTLDYRYNDRTPKYIIVVASSSKYGDYFIGSDEALLQLDNLELLYE